MALEVAWARRVSPESSLDGLDDVIHAVVDVARNAGSRVAVQDLERRLTYGELVSECAQVGASMAAIGVEAGDRVVLLIPNSVDYVVAALATLWIGAVFVPMDVQDAPRRLTSLIDDCSPTLIIVQDDGLVSSDLRVDGVRTLALRELAGRSNDMLNPVSPNDRPAYIIYTSGTTGVPKGVVIGNRAFSAAVESLAAGLPLDSSTRTLCVKPFHFDGSFATLFPTLVCGGTVVLRPREALVFPRVFFNTVASESITNTGMTPSYLRTLSSSPQFGQLASSSLVTLGLGGEAISPGPLRNLWSVAPHIRVFNRYGPTETTIAVTQVEITPTMLDENVIPIGVPHPGVEFLLLDDEGAVVTEKNHSAELYIGGIQLMDGYWNSPELTHQVLGTTFVAGRRLYRTRDLVYRADNGNYVYVERTDRLVKREGARISMAEITAALQSHPNVDTVSTLSFEKEGSLGIATFVLLRMPTEDVELRRWMQERLPSWSMPDRIEVIESLPLTKSGKTDETKLLGGVGLRPVARQSRS